MLVKGAPGINCVMFTHIFWKWFTVTWTISSLSQYGYPSASEVQYIPRNMHTALALLCFVVVMYWLIYPYPSGLLHWHCGNLTIAPVPAKQPWWIWVNASCEFIMNDYITTTKQSTTKPRANVLGYSVALKKTGKLDWHQTTTKHKKAQTMCMVYLCNVWITTVYPKKYAHGFCFAVLCCGYTLTDFPISIRLTSLALWQSNDCPSASKATLMNMDKYFMWIHYERLHNHNKAKHNKTVCIFLGIYCM